MPKTLFLLMLVGTALAVAGVAFAYFRYQKLTTIHMQWNEIGGMSDKWAIVPPWGGFSGLRLGGAHGHRPVRSISEVNRRIVAITALPNGDRLRLDAELKKELPGDGKTDGEVLIALLKGVRIESLSLIGWDVDDSSYVQIVKATACTRLTSEMAQDQADRIAAELQSEGIVCNVVVFRRRQ